MSGPSCSSCAVFTKTKELMIALICIFINCAFIISQSGPSMMSSRDLLRPISSDRFVPSQSDPFESSNDYDESESKELFSTPTIEELSEMSSQPSLPSQSESSQPILKTPNNSQSQESIEKVAVNSVRRLRFRETIEERTITDVDSDMDSMEIDEPSKDS